MNNRMVLYSLLIISGVLLGCDDKDTQVPKTTRSISIAGMPVYEKDFRLQPLLADNTQIQQKQ